jgi:hypothetical protein
MNWTIATGCVAVYGALLSTWNALSSYWEKRRRVTIKTSYGFETYGPELGPNSIIVTALNKGHRTVSLRGAGIRLPDGRDVIHLGQSGDARFPHQLDGGHSCMICMPMHSIAVALKQAGFSGTVRLAGYYRDALDKTYTSKRFKFDVETIRTEP